MFKRLKQLTEKSLNRIGIVFTAIIKTDVGEPQASRFAVICLYLWGISSLVTWIGYMSLSHNTILIGLNFCVLFGGLIVWSLR